MPTFASQVGIFFITRMKLHNKVNEHTMSRMHDSCPESNSEFGDEYFKIKGQGVALKIWWQTGLNYSQRGPQRRIRCTNTYVHQQRKPLVCRLNAWGNDHLCKKVAVNFFKVKRNYFGGAFWNSI